MSRAQASSVNAALQAAASRHVTVVAASGDIGAVAEPCDVYAALPCVGTFTPVKEVTCWPPTHSCSAPAGPA